MSADHDSDFVFVPADLAEDVDLPLELRKDILYLHAHLGRWTHWKVLGVPWNAPVAAVRAAYVEKVKRFHPDRYAGRKLGSFLPRIEKIFHALTLARDELTDQRRAAYVARTTPPDEAKRVESGRAVEAARAQERRERLARTHPLTARVSRVQQLFQRGKQAMADGKFNRAANDFLTVAGLDPKHPEARTLAEEAKRLAAADRAQGMYEAALAAEAIGSHARALAILREAIEVSPENARYATAASRIAIECGDADAARMLAEQAVRSAPRDARALEALGVALAAQGNAREARRAIEQALEIDPELTAARALAKKLRWSFLR